MKSIIVLTLIAVCNSQILLEKVKKISKRDLFNYGGCGTCAQSGYYPLPQQPIVMNQQPYQYPVAGPQLMMRPPVQVIQPQQQFPYQQQALQYYGSGCASCLSNNYQPTCYQSCSGFNNQCIVGCSPQCQSRCNSVPIFSQFGRQPVFQ